MPSEGSRQMCPGTVTAPWEPGLVKQVLTSAVIQAFRVLSWWWWVFWSLGLCGGENLLLLASALGPRFHSALF